MIDHLRASAAALNTEFVANICANYYNFTFFPFLPKVKENNKRISLKSSDSYRPEARPANKLVRLPGPAKASRSTLPGHK